MTIEAKRDLTVIILTFNEEMHIERAIDSIRPIVEDIIVVDSCSTDLTVQKALELGATVVQHEFINHAKQFQWALDNCSFESEWVMRLDADEYFSPELVRECRERLAGLPAEISGINLRRRQIFMDRWIRYGDRYPLILLRIWRRGRAHIEQRWMDEHIVLDEGHSITFDNDFYDHNLNSISWWMEKHNNYATREALDVIISRRSLSLTDSKISQAGIHSQASRKRLIKELIYNRFPLGTGPLLYFFYRYFLRAGFLDGKEGLVYHALQGFWYRFLVDVKVFEMERAISDVADKKIQLDVLQRLTGYPIAADGND